MDHRDEMETLVFRRKKKTTKKLQNGEDRSGTMGRGTGSSGRCRPQTLQRFLSLGFNSMLSACHSDLRCASNKNGLQSWTKATELLERGEGAGG